MLAVPQSTALLVVFKAFLSSDHVSEATGKTIAITISKNGGAFGNPAAGATNATEISSGWYKVSLGTGDTDTLGPLAIRGAVATVDDVGMWYQVVSATTGGWTNLDAAISAVKAKTDNLPSDPADASDIAASFTSLQSHGDSSWATATGFATTATAAAIKAKTDSLTFTKAGEVDSNICSVNDVTVNGTGAHGDEWGP